jgi:MFS family permease
MTNHWRRRLKTNTGYYGLVRSNSNFRFIWFGQIISLLGDWFNLIASASLIAQLTNSGTAIGGLFVVRMLAPFLVSPIAGVVADRYNRKYVLIATDLTRALTVFGFLLVRHPSQIWLLYTLTAIQLGISGFFFPTRNAILPDLVSRQELGAANALSSATWSVMLALGAALGGIVSGAWGIYPAFVVDALSFLFSATFIAQITYRPNIDSGAAEKTISAALRQYLDGLRYLRQQPDILTIALHKAANSLLIAGGFQVLQVTIAEKIFVIGKEGGISLGLMFAVAGVGTGIGPILARRFVGDEEARLRLALVAGYAITALGMVVIAPLFNFSVLLVGILLRGVGGGMIWVFSTQLLLQLVPNRVRGRVFSTEFAMFTLMSAAGSGAVGAMMDTSFGPSQILWGMAGLILIPGILWTMWLVVGRSGQTVPEDTFIKP